MPDSKRDASRKIARFRENIIQRVNAECDEITREVEELRKNELSHLDSDSIESETLEKEKAMLKVSFQREISSRKQELKVQYYSKREALRAELFDDVRRRLAEFANTAGYSAWLSEQATPHNAMTLYTRSADAVKLPEFNVVADDSSVELGGFIAVGDGIRIDKTFERLLSEQEEWFLINFALAE